MDPDIAKIMNDNFINVKVDREERPDIDAAYIRAVEYMTGQAGWPLTVFLTPDLYPFYGGTYFPPGDGYDHPSFRRVLAGVNSAWRTDGKDIKHSAGRIRKDLVTNETPTKESVELNSKVLQKATTDLLKDTDNEYGGLISPQNTRKYPQPCTLELALKGSLTDSSLKPDTRTACSAYLTTTLNKMAFGGIHDQLAGGFARYTMDKRWRVPHFEKMLYDNACLSRIYLQASQVDKNSYWASIGKETLDFALREMRIPEGAFGTSLDADSQGKEGEYYLFTPQQVLAALGASDGAWFNDIYGISAQGNIAGRSILHLSDTPQNLANKYGLSVEKFWQRLNPLRTKLLAVRSKRVKPSFDDKTLCGWNALMTSSLVEGYRVTGDSRYLQAARQTQGFILSKMYLQRQLRHSWAKGKPGVAGFLDDYAYEIQALLDLASVDFNPRWLTTAQQMTESMLRNFWDGEKHYFLLASSHQQAVLMPLVNHLDAPLPSGSSQAIFALLRLERITGNNSYSQVAQQALRTYVPAAVKYPAGYACLLSALDFYLAKRAEVVLVADSKKTDWRPLQRELNRVYDPNTITVFYDPKLTGPALRNTPLLKGRSLIKGLPAVYICRNYTCDAPITNVQTLMRTLSRK